MQYECSLHDVQHFQHSFEPSNGQQCVNHHFVVWSKRGSGKEAIVVATPVGKMLDGANDQNRLRICCWQGLMKAAT